MNERARDWVETVAASDAASLTADENLLYLDPDGYVDGARWSSALHTLEALLEVRQSLEPGLLVTMFFPLTSVDVLAPQDVALSDVERSAEAAYPAFVLLERNPGKPSASGYELYRCPLAWQVDAGSETLAVQVELIRSAEERACNEPYRRHLVIAPS